MSSAKLVKTWIYAPLFLVVVCLLVSGSSGATASLGSGEGEMSSAEQTRRDIEQRLHAIGGFSGSNNSLLRLIGNEEASGAGGLSSSTAELVLRPEARVLLDMYMRLEANQRDTLQMGSASTVRAFPASLSRSKNGKKIILAFGLGKMAAKEIPNRVELRIQHLDHYGDRVQAQNLRFRMTLDQGTGRKATMIFSRNPEELLTDGYMVLNLSDYVKALKNDVGQFTSRSQLFLSFRTLRRHTKRHRRETNEEDEHAISGPGNNSNTTINNTTDTNEFDSALLVVFSSNSGFTDELTKDITGSQARHRRRTRRGTASLTLGCAHQEYIVDFDKMEWGNFIIQPKKYTDVYCFGQCSSLLSQRNNLSLHSIIQWMISTRGDSDIPGLSCVPTKLKEQSFLINKDGEMVLEVIQDTIASGCECR